MGSLLYRLGSLLLSGVLCSSGCDTPGRPILVGDLSRDTGVDRLADRSHQGDRTPDLRSDLLNDVLASYCTGPAAKVTVDGKQLTLIIQATSFWAGPGNAIGFDLRLMGMATDVTVKVMDYFVSGGPDRLEISSTGQAACTTDAAKTDNNCWLSSLNGDQVSGTLALTGGKLTLCLQAVRASGHARGSCCALQDVKVYLPASSPPP